MGKREEGGQDHTFKAGGTSVLWGVAVRVEKRG